MKTTLKNTKKYHFVYLRKDDSGTTKTIHRKYIEGKNKSSALNELQALENTHDSDIEGAVLCREEVAVHIGDEVTDESVNQMEQVFKEFKKESGWMDFNDMKFSINGEEYWIHRCL